MTLDQLRDVIQLQALKALYCEAVDGCVTDALGSASRLREVFTEDATADYGAEILEGRHAIIDFLIVTLSTTSDAAWHAIHSPRIDVEGDAAIGRWTVMARRRAKGSTHVDTIVGRYVDDFRRTPQGWRIRHVCFRRES